MRGGDRGARPPAWAHRLLGLFLPRRERARLLAEMETLWRRRRERHGPAAADHWYVRHTLGFPPRLLGEAAGRAVRGLGVGIAGLAREVRHGVRVLARRPGYALTSALTLAVGVGGVATVFNAADWVLLRPVPGVTGQDELVTLRLELADAAAGPAFPVSDPDLADLRNGIQVLRGLAGEAPVELHVEVGEGGAPVRLPGSVVTSDWFDVLGVRAWRGRLLDGAGADADAVVVSHRLWHDRLGGRNDLAGTTLRINGRAFQVVGVAPPGFHGAELPGSTELWLAAPALPAGRIGAGEDVLRRRNAGVWTGMVGRLAPGALPEAVAEQGEAVIERITAEHGWNHSFAGPRFRYAAYAGVGLSPRVRESVGRTLALLAGAAAILLALAVANLANLGLTHAVSRSGETAVHLAIGAGRRRVVRRVLAEHLVLGVAGTAGALLVAAAGILLFREASLSSLGASLQGMRLDLRVAAVAAAAALAAAAAASVVPALVATRGDVLVRLQGRRHGSRGTRHTQSALVTVQVALSVALLVGAGLLARSVVNLRSVDPGYEAEGALRFSVDPRLQGYDEVRVRELVDGIEGRLTREPGIVAVGFVSPAFVRGSFLTTHLHRPGSDAREDMVVGAQFEVTPGFLRAAGIEPLAGRSFEAADARPLEEGGERPVIVAEGMARRTYRDLEPAALVGRVLVRSGPQGFDARVVGVVEDLRPTGALDRDPPPVVLHPWGHGWADGPLTAWVRVAGEPAAATSRVRAAVREVDPSLPIFDLRTVRQQTDLLIVEQRVVARLAVSLAVVGLLLAAIGLHGVLGYSVTSRRREIGVRAALGAGPGSIVAGLVRSGLALTLTGLALGGAAAVPLVRVVESRLYGVAALDPATFAATAAVLLAVALVATWAPARRAARVSPVEVLSAE